MQHKFSKWQEITLMFYPFRLFSTIFCTRCLNFKDMILLCMTWCRKNLMLRRCTFCYIVAIVVLENCSVFNFKREREKREPWRNTIKQHWNVRFNWKLLYNWIWEFIYITWWDSSTIKKKQAFSVGNSFALLNTACF